MSNRLSAGTVWVASFIVAATACAGEKLRRPADVAKAFDETLRAELQIAPKDLAPNAEPATILRRLWLDTVGYPPPIEEAKAVFRKPEALDVAASSRELLHHPDFAANWSWYWVEVLRERSLMRRYWKHDEELASLLQSELQAEKPWSEIATRVVTSQSHATFFAHDATNPGFAAGEASRVLLGISIECAECHDHPFASWKQNHYREFAAFFDQALLAPGQEMRPVDDPEKSLADVTPRFFLDGFSVKIAANDRERRSAVAERIVSPENPWFARAFVNRLCGELLGQGFYDLPDDLGPDRACVAPQALDLLADDFAASNYDVRRSFEIVLSTQTYRLRATSHGDETFRPFACNRVQPLRSDQFVETLLRTLAMRTPEAFDEPIVDENRRSLGMTPREQVREVFGFSPSQDRGDVRRGVTQALFLMNSELIERAILDPNRPGGPAALIARARDNDELADALYLHVLGRRPNERERLLAIDALFAAPTREEAFVDLTWALLNSAEFSHRP